jgi:hypothetical protein|uniref:Uncharacterized protein n=1 Tax=viral metagenome TaxID=1070528 RepID=A0A6H1ZC18_9ZZZZ
MSQNAESMKCFVVEYTTDTPDGYDIKLFNYETGQRDAERFCAEVKAKGGAVNIKIRDVLGAVDPFSEEE